MNNLKLFRMNFLSKEYSMKIVARSDEKVTVNLEELVYTLSGKPEFMLDVDLAVVYQTTTENIRRAVRNNADLFPESFYFQLVDKDLRRLQIGAKYSKDRGIPLAFHREGANMLAAFIRTKAAKERLREIVKVFSTVEERRQQQAKQSDDVEQGQMLLFDVGQPQTQRKHNHERNLSIGNTNEIVKAWRDKIHALYPIGLKEEAKVRAEIDNLPLNVRRSYQEIFRCYPEWHGYAMVSAFANKCMQHWLISEEKALKWAAKLVPVALEIGHDLYSPPALPCPSDAEQTTFLS